MRVWVMMSDCPGRGGDIIGVFATEEEARAALPHTDAYAIEWTVGQLYRNYEEKVICLNGNDFPYRL